MKRTCKQCGKEFIITQSEINFYKSKNLSIPKRCKECRQSNKQQRENTEKTNGEVSYPNTSQAKKGSMPKIVTAVLAVLALVYAIFGLTEKEISAVENCCCPADDAPGVKSL